MKFVRLQNLANQSEVRREQGQRIGVISGRSSREHLLKETLMLRIAAVGCTAFDFGDGSRPWQPLPVRGSE